ncbi:lytic murein transglycosylase [Pelagivirga sediminicola]|uniref:Lytic murein transglycosylase n=1 Tax=Pelagivirga sediminicola TaxID=2170575 RepID=A0A2T7G659_9RHOB|nr:lytic murein transglycosylase [Pelagivirga sediminicola]PVA09912.1 lytic murein transglycosylase [Pelagivirga sediminicola]
MTRAAWTGAVLALMASQGMAGPQVTQSPRPEVRPETLAQAAIATATPQRPAPRPGDLSLVAPAPAALANPRFDAWITGFRSRALAAGIAGAVFDAAFAGVTYDTKVIELDRNQSEFTKQIWDYLDTAVSEQRVSNGKAALAQHADALDRIEARFGVEKEVVAAIWGLESAYGAARGARPLIASLATLAHDGRRGAFFEEQLIAALRIIQAGDVAPRAMTGSWAGAMGHTQFIPTSYLTYAVDFTGDGRRDIWSDDPVDALASTAAYLATFGWKKGQPWGVEVRLPDGFDPALARRSLMRSPAAWAAEGIRDMNGKPVPNHGNASILLPAGSSGAAFMIFDNFAVIERYNKADAYVIGVGHLSDRLKGGPAIQGEWPRHYHPISSAQKKDIQTRLQSRGFAVQKIDGIIGPNTIDAIRAFQQSAGLRADGYPSQELLKALGG